MKLYINPHTNPIKSRLIEWEGDKKILPKFEPHDRYYVEVPMLTSNQDVELQYLKVYFTTNREHRLTWCAIPIGGYSTGSIRIYEDEQSKTFAELTDGVLDSKEKYFHGA